MQNQFTSRRFLRGTGAAAGAAIGLPTIVAARALGKDGQKPPSERITGGLIGTGGIAPGKAPSSRCCRRIK